MSARYYTEAGADGSVVVITRAGATLPAWTPKGWRIQQGGTAYLLVSLVNGDAANSTWPLTGFTASLKARENYGDTATLFTATNGSGITLGNNAPNIIVKLTPAVTAALDFTGGVFDLELGYSGEVLKVLSGPVYLTPEAGE